MPNTSAGMVIGKSGTNIKDIRETYGCQIQVFPKAGSPEAQNSLERIVTLAHEDHSQLIQATSRVLEKVVADPHHTSEINKEDFSGKGGQTRTGNTSFTSTPAFTNGNTAAAFNAAPPAFAAQTYGYQANQQQPTMKFNPMSGLGNQELLSFLDNLQSTLRSSGFNEASVAEVMQAMQV
ncbi:KH domain protein, partial [Cooperia oncophora]